MKRENKSLAPSLEHGLNMYALAACAAEVGMLASAQPSEAKIIYTKANVKIHNHSILNLDHGRKGDFSFRTWRSSTTSGGRFQLFVGPVGTRNRIWGTGESASALGSGVRVGPNKKKFAYGHYLMGTWFGNWNSSGSRGPWRYATNGYLGLRFMIKEKIHYGWARLFVQGSGDEATLTGYAYETIPNKPIITGKTKGPDVITLEPGSLGALAAGSSRRNRRK